MEYQKSDIMYLDLHGDPMLMVTMFTNGKYMIDDEFYGSVIVDRGLSSMALSGKETDYFYAAHFMH